MVIWVFVKNLLLVAIFQLSCVLPIKGCVCPRISREDRFCSSDYAVIGRLIGRFVTPGIKKNIFVVQVQFHIKGSGPKYIELESPMGLVECGTLLDVGQDYIIAGKIISGIRGALNACSWKEKWKEVPFLTRWHLLQKQITCNEDVKEDLDEHKQMMHQNRITLYHNVNQKLRYPRPPHTNQVHPMPHPDKPLNQVYQISHPSKPLNQVHQMSHPGKPLNQVHQMSHPGKPLNQVHQMSHPGKPLNQVHPMSHSLSKMEGLHRMVKMYLRKQRDMEDPPENTDHIGRQMGVTMLGGYRHRNMSHLYRQYQEAMDK